MRRLGMTLAEMLVVLAIIAVLGAIMCPVMSHCQAKGRQSKCVSNVRQIGLAVVNYSSDWQDALPFPCNEVDPGLWWQNTWRQRIHPYIRNQAVFHCPEPTKSPDADAMGGVDQGHYGMNFALTHPPYTRATESLQFGFSFLRDIARVTSTILIGENRDGDWSSEPYSSYQADSGPSGHFWPYHLGGGVWLFCDGHARWMRVEQTEQNNFYYWRKAK